MAADSSPQTWRPCRFADEVFHVCSRACPTYWGWPVSPRSGSCFTPGAALESGRSETGAQLHVPVTRGLLQQHLSWKGVDTQLSDIGRKAPDANHYQSGSQSAGAVTSNSAPG